MCVSLAYVSSFVHYYAHEVIRMYNTQAIIILTVRPKILKPQQTANRARDSFGQKFALRRGLQMCVKKKDIYIYIYAFASAEIILTTIQGCVIKGWCTTSYLAPMG